MKKSIAVVALALAAGFAYADDPTLDTGAFASTKTRAEVQAERATVKRDVWASSYNPLTMTQPAKTRSRVLGELEGAQESGQLRAFGGEDGGSAYLAAQATRRARNASRLLAGTPPVAQ